MCSMCNFSYRIRNFSLLKSGVVICNALRFVKATNTDGVSSFCRLQSRHVSLILKKVSRPYFQMYSEILCFLIDAFKSLLGGEHSC